MSADLRKIAKLKKKAIGNSGISIEVDLILDESNPKYSWDMDTWEKYFAWQESKGHTIVFLTGDTEEVEGA